MKRPDAKLLLDMLQSARLAVSYLGETDRVAFGADLQLQDAVARRLEVLGEAAARVTAETRAALPDVPWREMVGMRNRIVHEYFQMDLDVLWDVVHGELPPLITRLADIVPPPDGPTGTAPLAP